MTFVGRIFVIVIMAFSLLFLGISTVVFTTTKNWKNATEAEKKNVAKLQNDLKNAQAGSDAAKKELEAAKTAYDTQTKELADRIKALDGQIGTDREQITAARSKVADAQTNAKTALVEAEERRNETFKLRDTKAAIEKQANDYKLRQTELNDRIRELERMLETTTRNRDDLRDRVARFSTLLRQNGLSDDISQVRGIESPPKVSGEVLRVDATGRGSSSRMARMKVSSSGMKCSSTGPSPARIFGKVKIIEVDPDQSVGRVIGRTVNGKKIREGDIVASTINP